MREMKFVCGACGEFSKKAFVSRHTASYVPHEACGYETFFPNFVQHKDARGKSIFDPVGTLVRPTGEVDAMPVAEFKEYLAAGRVKVPFQRKAQSNKPSGDDLDRVMEERTLVVTERLYSLALTPESAKQVIAHFGVEKLFETADLEALVEELDDASDAVKRVEEFDLGGPPSIETVENAIEILIAKGMTKKQARKSVAQHGADAIISSGGIPVDQKTGSAA